MGGIGAYRFGFNGKEKDTDGEWGKLTHYDYGFRIYNPGIGKFLSVDPIAKDYPWYTPYQFAGNMPVWAIDFDGLEPVVENGVLVGYLIKANQGPTQIAEDLNNPATMKKHGYQLQKKVNWIDIVKNAINNKKYFNKLEGNLFDSHNKAYESNGKFRTGNRIDLFFLQSDPFNKSGALSFTGTKNEREILMEAARIVFKADIGFGAMSSNEIVDINSKGLDILKDEHAGGKIKSGAFHDNESGIDFRITVSANSPKHKVGTTTKSIYGNTARDRKPNALELNQNPYAWDILIVTESISTGNMTNKSPELMKVSFKTEKDRDAFAEKAKLKF